MGFAVASEGAPAASALGPRSVAGACHLFNTGPPPHRRRDESNVDDSRLPPVFSLPPEPGCWLSKNDNDAMELKVAMLGMAKEQVKLSAYQDALLVKWEDVKGSDDDEVPAGYSCRINLSASAFKLDQTKAEMKDGLLTVTVSRIKGEVDLKCTDIKIE